jgi:hypothetical protein
MSKYDGATALFWAIAGAPKFNRERLVVAYACCIGSHAGADGEYWRPIHAEVSRLLGTRPASPKGDKFRKDAWAIVEAANAYAKANGMVPGGESNG